MCLPRCLQPHVYRVHLALPQVWPVQQAQASACHVVLGRTRHWQECQLACSVQVDRTPRLQAPQAVIYVGQAHLHRSEPVAAFNAAQDRFQQAMPLSARPALQALHPQSVVLS